MIQVDSGWIKPAAVISLHAGPSIIDLMKMKKYFILLFLFPLCTMAQRVTPKFEKDTLYTSSGFKIYEGQTLHFGKGTRPDGKFRYINIKSINTSSQLADNSIVVKKLKNFGISALGNGYIEIIGKINYSDGSKGYIDIHMAFDWAIENDLSKPSELIVPEEFRGKPIASVTSELERLYKLYQDGAITKEEYEAQKKRLLNQ